MVGWWAARLSCPTQYHAALRSLSRAFLVNSELAQSAVPPVGEIEDRHAEHKHLVVLSPPPPEYFSPPVGETLSLSFHFGFLSSDGSSTIYSLSLDEFMFLFVSE